MSTHLCEIYIRTVKYCRSMFLVCVWLLYYYRRVSTTTNAHGHAHTHTYTNTRTHTYIHARTHSCDTYIERNTAHKSTYRDSAATILLLQQRGMSMTIFQQAARELLPFLPISIYKYNEKNRVFSSDSFSSNATLLLLSPLLPIVAGRSFCLGQLWGNFSASEMPVIIICSITCDDGDCTMCK